MDSAAIASAIGSQVSGATRHVVVVIVMFLRWQTRPTALHANAGADGGLLAFLTWPRQAPHYGTMGIAPHFGL
jgi:hypothetical protein